jgi:hypothetical protein
LVLVVAWLVGPSLVSGAEKNARQLLPRSVAGYLEISQPKQLLDVVLDHPLTKQIENHPNYQQALKSPQYEKFQRAVRIVEEKLGMKLRPAVSALSAEGIYVAVDLPTQGLVVLVRSSDEKLTEQAREVLLGLVRAEAKNKGEADPVKIDDHRGIAIHQVREARIATHGRWLMASNKSLLLRLVLNSCLDDEVPCLEQEEQFQAAYKARPQEATAWAYGDLRLVKALGILKNALNKKSDNPGIELLAGGIVGALPNAPYVTAALELDATKLALNVSLPADVAAAARQREFYFGPDGQGIAPPLLQPKETLLSLATYRDFASLWRHAPDLFNEEVNAMFAEAEAGLGTFFAGRNFRDEILGNLEPGLQLVVARQEFSPDGITPTMKLPAAAVVVRMKNHVETARIFKITFQSAIGFLNIAGGMNGLDPLDVNSTKQGETLVVSAEYLPPKDEAARNAAPPHFNASPTAIFVGDKFILASAKGLALELAELVQKEEAPAANVNTLLKTDAQVLRKVLAENQEPLIAQNMLDKGHDRAAAEKEIGDLLKVLTAFQDSTVRLSTRKESLSLEWTVQLNPMSPAR